ncbi:MAG: hypothetical protein SOH68_03260 [Lactobacillus sp.]|jgi:hypothetical protein
MKYTTVNKISDLGPIKKLSLVNDSKTILQTSEFLPGNDVLIQDCKQRLSLMSNGHGSYSAFDLVTDSEIPPLSFPGLNAKVRCRERRRFTLSKQTADYLLTSFRQYFTEQEAAGQASDLDDGLKLRFEDENLQVWKGYLPTWTEPCFNGADLAALLRKYLPASCQGICWTNRILPAAGQHAFAIVAFTDDDEDSGREYCYLADQVQAYAGAVAIVQAGQELKTVRVKRVELHAAPDAPYPLDKCKPLLGLLDC